MTRTTRIVSYAVALVVSTRLFAQAPGVTPPRPSAPPGPAQPPRSQTAPVTGTAILRGRITDGITGQPLRRARISLASPALGREGRTANTDTQGRWEAKDLPAGRYTLTVRRSGYLELRYGQRRPYEPGKPLEISDAQVIEKVDFALPKMSVISGRITDEFGEPIENTLVLVWRTMYFNGQRRLVPTGRLIRTDDGGNYRQSGLVPGTYLVSARATESWTVETNGVSQTVGYVPTFYPGVERLADAQKVTVGVGKEINAIDLSLIPGKAVKVSGVAFDSRGQPFKRVSLGQEVRGDNFGSFGGGGGGNSFVGADGSFSIPNVTPGDYKLTAVTGDENGPGDHPEVAIMNIVVGTSDLDGISLVGSSGGSITGRLTTADGTELPKNVRISINQRLMGQPDPLLLGTFRSGSGGAGIGDIKSDGTFTAKNIFGPANFDVTPPDGWVVKAIVRDGRDITDAPVDMRSDEEWSGVEITLTNRLSTVTGQLVDAKGAPAEGTMIVFAADAAKWFDGSRFIKAVRPDQAGRAQLKGMPPGEYLAVGVDYVEDGAWFDREYLESMRAQAVKVTMGEGGTQSLTLKVVQ